jgi:hypothetical protein
MWCPRNFELPIVFVLTLKSDRVIRLLGSAGGPYICIFRSKARYQLNLQSRRLHSKSCAPQDIPRLPDPNIFSRKTVAPSFTTPSHEIQDSRGLNVLFKVWAGTVSSHWMKSAAAVFGQMCLRATYTSTKVPTPSAASIHRSS